MIPRVPQFGHMFMLDPSTKAQLPDSDTLASRLASETGKLGPFWAKIRHHQEMTHDLFQRMHAVAEGIVAPSKSIPPPTGDRPIAFILDHPLFMMGYALDGMSHSLEKVFQRITGSDALNVYIESNQRNASDLFIARKELETDYFNQYNPFAAHLKAKGYPVDQALLKDATGYLIRENGRVEQTRYNTP